MKKFLLFIFALSLCSCQNQGDLQQGADLKTQRLSDFEKYKELSEIHSNYLAYVFDYMDNEKRTSGTRSFTPRTSDELDIDLRKITQSFLEERIQLEGNTSCMMKALEQGIFSEIAISTRSKETIPFNPTPIISDFFLRIDQLPNGLDAAQFESAVETILYEDQFFALSSDEEFQSLAIAAATCIDSYRYWLDNYSNWVSEIFCAQNTRGFWGDVWTETKRLSKKDAEAALVSTPGAIAAGPAAGGVLFASAGVGSLYAAFSPYF